MSKFREYRTFVAVVEAGGISKAADHLNMSVSAASKQLSKLENDLKARLVDRSTKALSVTDHGYQFYQRCRDIIGSVEEAEQLLREDIGNPAGKISLSLSNVLLRTPLMKLLKEFCCQYPNIKFDINISDQFENLVEQQIDFAFRIGDLEDSRLTAVSLTETRLIFCASPEYIERKGRPEDFTFLMEHELIVPTYVNLSEVAGGMFSGANSLLNIQNYHTTNDYIALHEAGCEGLGVIVTLDIAVKKELEEGRLVSLFPSLFFHQKNLNLIYHQRQYMPEKMRLFKLFLKDRSNAVFTL